MITSHWGITVNSEIPITGVLNINSAEWLNEDITNGIDLDFEEHIKECKNEYHDECYNNDTPSTVLIGYKKNDKTGLYDIDEDKEYSAIINEVYAQITHSQYVSRCDLCSPCYPGQGDLDNKGDYLAYTLPTDVFGDFEHLPIFKLEDLKILQIIRDNDLNISMCSDGFFIIDSWEDLNKFVAAYNHTDISNIEYGRLNKDRLEITDMSIDQEFKTTNDILKEHGFSDEYGCCDNCHNHIELMTMGKIDYHIFDGSLICGDCIRDDKNSYQEDYLTYLINNDKTANTILSDKQIEALGFKKCMCNKQECYFESGLHPGQTDNPKEILKHAIAKNPNKEYIFDILTVNMFETDYTIWSREKKQEDN